ncbi:PhzF family phenazine biosynthesis protein, partial [Rhodospirillales bacterium]|nr:PhzF family phenazine biosynthesis protein [Rhodospirillales bacterium]
MTTIPIFQLDAFTDKPFGGNPAAVCPLQEWLPDDVMQSIALENNVSDTAFYVPEGDGFLLRWFTPKIEVDLCGHATLATAWLILNELEPDRASVAFETRSGTLTVSRDGDLLAMDFPVMVAEERPAPAGLAEAIGIEPVKFLKAVMNMAVLENEAVVRAVNPDFGYIKNMDGMGLIITALGDQSDCASRYFAPHAGIDEDPVTGSAHCTIVPYWSGVLGKAQIHARQVSARSGDLYCLLEGDRVVLTGKARTV